VSANVRPPIVALAAVRAGVLGMLIAEEKEADRPLAAVIGGHA
jgi:hypothetical protein